MSRPSSRLSLTSLHDAARKGDSRSLKRLITIIDPEAADKVAAVLLRRDSGNSVSIRVATSTRPSTDKKDKAPQTKVVRGKRRTVEKTLASPLKRLLQKQDTKRRTALYVACAAGNTEVADTLLAVGASSEGHGAWQRTPLHIAAFEGHTSAIRSLLGAGADPWALNGRGQTPSDLSSMYNANEEVLDLLKQAGIMRRVISTGGMVGATFVHDDGEIGTVAAVIEQWSFTLEVELDRWKLGKRSGARVYLPVRGQRHHTSTRSSEDKLSTSTGHRKVSSAQLLPPKRCDPSIPWLAKTVGRLRLESDGLLKVNARSLVGARADTPLGCGAVISVRDVSVRCEVETVRVREEKSVEDVTTTTMNTTFDKTEDGTSFAAGDGQHAVLTNESQGYHNASTTEYGSFSPTGVERGHSGSSESLWVDESSRQKVGHGDQNEGGVEMSGRVKRQDGECCQHAKPPPTGFNRELNERIIHVASRKGAPGTSSRGAYRRVGLDGRTQRGDGEDDNSDAWDGCSVGTETAADLEQGSASALHERTSEDFEPERVDDGSWTAHKGSVSHTCRHAFQDNLVPFAALEGVVEYQTLPPSATTWLSRARRRRLLAQWRNRHQQKAATPQSWSTSTMLEVDDLIQVGPDRGVALGNAREEIGDGGNDALVAIVGLEEQIEREERSDEKMDKKRINMEATRSAVFEALELWSRKAGLLQARLMVLKNMAATASAVSGSTTSTTVHNSSNSNTMSLEEYLASPSPRCCACDTRGGYQQATSITPAVPTSETRPSVAAPACLETIDAAQRFNDAERSTTNDGGSSLCAIKNQLHHDGLANSDYGRSWMDSREEQLVVHLQECLKHMTHLRDWLQLLDQELR